MELLIGLFGGFLLSILFWWILNHIILSNLQFSNEISRSSVKFYKSGARYQFAIKNYGKRNALNVRFQASIAIRDILKTGGRLRNFHDIKIGRKEMLCMRPNITTRKTIFIDESPCFEKSIFSQSVRDKYKKGILTLDDIFSEYPDSYLRIQVLAVDSVSSSTKFFSKNYRARDIISGKFPPKSMTVVPEK